MIGAWFKCHYHFSMLVGFVQPTSFVPRKDNVCLLKENWGVLLFFRFDFKPDKLTDAHQWNQNKGWDLFLPFLNTFWTFLKVKWLILWKEFKLAFAKQISLTNNKSLSYINIQFLIFIVCSIAIVYNIFVICNLNYITFYFIFHLVSFQLRKKWRRKQLQFALTTPMWKHGKWNLM